MGHTMKKERLGFKDSKMSSGDTGESKSSGKQKLQMEEAPSKHSDWSGKKGDSNK